jgi:hypothetical protein
MLHLTPAASRQAHEVDLAAQDWKIAVSRTSIFVIDSSENTRVSVAMSEEEHGALVTMTQRLQLKCTNQERRWIS